MWAADCQAAMALLSVEQKFGVMWLMVLFRAVNSASLSLISAFLLETGGSSRLAASSRYVAPSFYGGVRLGFRLGGRFNVLLALWLKPPDGKAR